MCSKYKSVDIKLKKERNITIKKMGQGRCVEWKMFFSPNLSQKSSLIWLNEKVHDSAL